MIMGKRQKTKSLPFLKLLPLLRERERWRCEGLMFIFGVVSSPGNILLLFVFVFQYFLLGFQFEIYLIAFFVCFTAPKVQAFLLFLSPLWFEIFFFFFWSIWSPRIFIFPKNISSSSSSASILLKMFLSVRERRFCSWRQKRFAQLFIFPFLSPILERRAWLCRTVCERINLTDSKPRLNEPKYHLQMMYVFKQAF